MNDKLSKVRDLLGEAIDLLNDGDADACELLLLIELDTIRQDVEINRRLSGPNPPFFYLYETLEI